MQKQISTLLKHGPKTLKHSVVRGRKTHISKKKSQITLKKLRGGSGTGSNPRHEPTRTKLSFRTNPQPTTSVTTVTIPQPSKEKEHFSYFFVKCYNYDDTPMYTDLDGAVLETFLNKLGVKPDDAIKSIQIFDKKSTKYNNENNNLVNMNQSDFCKGKPYPLFSDIKLKSIHIKAKIFIFDINSLHMNKRYYNLPKYLVNIFNKTTITKIIDKYNLTLSFKAIAPEATKLFIPNTINIKNLIFNPDTPPKWYVLRPIDGYGGKDIYYVNSTNELEIAKQFYKHNNIYGVSSNIKKSYGDNVIASEYITTPLLFKTPLLFETLKCHLRLYYLVFYSKEHKVFNSFYLDTLGKIFTAKLPFKMEDASFKNTDVDKLHAKSIHDTHTNSTADDYFYPDIFTHDMFTLSDGTTSFGKTVFNEKFEDMKNQIKLIMSIISEIMVKKCTGGKCNELLYDKDDNAYHIFGIDIMIDGGDSTNPNEKFTPKLIEINFAPGFGHKNKDSAQKKLSDEVYGWINTTVLEPLLKPLDPLDPLKPLEVQKPDEITIKKRLFDIRKHSTYIIPYNELIVKEDYKHSTNIPILIPI